MLLDIDQISLGSYFYSFSVGKSFHVIVIVVLILRLSQFFSVEVIVRKFFCSLNNSSHKFYSSSIKNIT